MNGQHDTRTVQIHRCWLLLPLVTSSAPPVHSARGKVSLSVLYLLRSWPQYQLTLCLFFASPTALHSLDVSRRRHCPCCFRRWRQRKQQRRCTASCLSTMRQARNQSVLGLQQSRLLLQRTPSRPQQHTAKAANSHSHSRTTDVTVAYIVCCWPLSVVFSEITGRSTRPYAHKRSDKHRQSECSIGAVSSAHQLQSITHHSTSACACCLLCVMVA